MDLVASTSIVCLRMTEPGDDLALAFSFFKRSTELFAHIQQLAAYTTSLQGISSIHDADDSFSDEEGPGRGNTINGRPKAPCLRRIHQQRYKKIREEDPDLLLFEKVTHLSREEFDYLLVLVQEEQSKTLDVRQNYDSLNDFRQPRKRRLQNDECLFLLFEMLSSANEGGLGDETLGHNYGISPGTLSNYFRHTFFSLFKSLDKIKPRLIE